MNNDTLMFYAKMLKKHCRELGSCKYCIFNHKNSDNTTECKLDDLPEFWRLEGED